MGDQYDLRGVEIVRTVDGSIARPAPRFAPRLARRYRRVPSVSSVEFRAARRQARFGANAESGVRPGIPRPIPGIPCRSSTPVST